MALWTKSGFDKLGDDVITRIFYQGTFVSPDVDGEAPLMPLLYSSVCKEWRRLALGASSLWGFIAFDDKEPYNLTRLFLERSRSAPLVIEIDLTDWVFDDEDQNEWPSPDIITRRLALFIPHTHRWRILCCRADNSAPIQEVLHLLQNLTVPILKRLELTQNFDTGRFDPVIPFPQGGAPALEELVIVNVFDIVWCNDAFQNLSELTLDKVCGSSFSPLRHEEELSSGWIPVQEFWTLLSRSPNLRRLSLIGGGPLSDQDIEAHLPTLDLLYLEELKILGNPDPDVGVDFALFILCIINPGPALYYLFIGNFMHDDDPSEIVPVLRHKYAHVKRLRVVGGGFSLDNAIDWLEALPSLCYLTPLGMARWPFMEALLAEGSENQPHLCPSLTTFGLDLSMRPDSFPDPELLIYLMKERISFQCPIRKLVVKIRHKHYLDEMDDEGFEYLKSVAKISFEVKPRDPRYDWIGYDPDWEGWGENGRDAESD